jgi:hypothetical protein
MIESVNSRRENPVRQFFFCPIIVLLFLIALPLAAQEDGTLPTRPEEDVVVDTYTLGDQLLTINLGLFTPLFFASEEKGVQSTNLTLGGVGSLRWSSYLNNNISVGAEVAGSFSFSPNRRALYILPITARGTYYFRAYPWEFPLSLQAGMSISRLEEKTKIDPILKPGASVYWNHNAQWAFGLNAVYWWIPQIYRGPEPPASDTRFGNFLELTLSALYHF